MSGIERRIMETAKRNKMPEMANFESFTMKYANNEKYSYHSLGEAIQQEYIHTTKKYSTKRNHSQA